MEMRKGSATLSEAFMKLGLRWFEEEYSEGLDLYSRRSVFNGAITMWLMIAQKGVAEDSLVSAVQQLRHTKSVDEIAQLVAKSKKFALAEISNHPGGFTQARQRLPLCKVAAFSDHVSEAADREHRDLCLLYGYLCYVCDGSTIALQNTKDIRKEFMPQGNQYGECAPAARVVVAHNVVSGVATRPEIGSVKESEQAMCAPLMKRLPKRSVMIGDRNFGVFSVAWHATENSLLPLIRLQEQRALRVSGKHAIAEDFDLAVEWTPSKNDRAHTDLPADAAIKGRVIAITITAPQKRAERFFFFTTIKDLTPEQIAEIYKKRWYIETDLRSIKTTAHLDMVKSKSADVAKKEIILGVLAYTMLRTIIARGAKMLKLQPRDFSFSRARQFILTTTILLGRAENAKEAQLALSRFLTDLRQAKHPHRKKFRTEPRAIVGNKRHKFSSLKGTREEARQALILKRMSEA